MPWCTAAGAGMGHASPTCWHRRNGGLAAVEFEADLLAWQESEEGQEWQAMVAEELAADVAAAAANERALREAPETGFATLAELVAFEMAA